MIHIQSNLKSNATTTADVINKHEETTWIFKVTVSGSQGQGK